MTEYVIWLKKQVFTRIEPDWFHIENNVNTNNMKYICEYLKRNEKVDKISLYNNLLNNTDIECLIEYITNTKRCIKELWVHGNHNFGNEEIIKKCIYVDKYWRQNIDCYDNTERNELIKKEQEQERKNEEIRKIYKMLSKINDENEIMKEKQNILEEENKRLKEKIYMIEMEKEYYIKELCEGNEKRIEILEKKIEELREENNNRVEKKIEELCEENMKKIEILDKKIDIIKERNNENKIKIQNNNDTIKIMRNITERIIKNKKCTEEEYVTKKEYENMLIRILGEMLIIKEKIYENNNNDIESEYSETEYEIMRIK